MGVDEGGKMKEASGVLTLEDLGHVIPSKERLEKGRVAIIECVQKIPCDPCVHACKLGAIIKESLVDPPTVDYSKCTGCGLCISQCPGLAIFVVDFSYSNDEAMIMLPYEFLHLPNVGEIVIALDRSGKELGTARVVKAQKTKDYTNVVSITVKKEIAMSVRGIKRRSK